jgi:hypothetical protein
MTKPMRVSLEFSPTTSDRQVASDVSSAILKDQVAALVKDLPSRRLLKEDIKPDELTLLRRGERAGLIRGPLLQVEITDEYSGGRRIEHIGDDDGATWHQFANVPRIGKLNSLSAFPQPKGWWQK